MATLVTPERLLIYAEGAQFRSAVSEELIQRQGAVSNFISLYQYNDKQFFANGRYGIMSSYPQLGVDGLVFMNFNAEIINAWVWNLVAGTGGTTELDIKRATTPGGAFTSIFSTTPKITSSAAANVWADWQGTVVAPTGVTAPVVTTVNLNAGDALRLDIITAMTGTPENTGILINFRPR